MGSSRTFAFWSALVIVAGSLWIGSGQAQAQTGRYRAWRGYSPAWSGYAPVYNWSGYAPTVVATPTPTATAPVANVPAGRAWQGYAPATAWTGYNPQAAWTGYIPGQRSAGRTALTATQEYGPNPYADGRPRPFYEYGTGRHVATIKPWLPGSR